MGYKEAWPCACAELSIGQAWGGCSPDPIIAQTASLHYNISCLEMLGQNYLSGKLLSKPFVLGNLLLLHSEDYIQREKGFKLCVMSYYDSSDL